MAQKYRRLIPIVAWTILFTLGILFWFLAIKYGYTHVLAPVYSYLSTHVPIEWALAVVIIAVIALDPLKKAWRK